MLDNFKKLKLLLNNKEKKKNYTLYTPNITVSFFRNNQYWFNYSNYFIFIRK